MIKQKLNAGFTLYELLITIAIVTILAGIVFFNASKFNTDIEITNLAYRMALSVRQAQIYSISVKQLAAGAADFDISYGLHFNAKNGVTAAMFFADANGDGVYTPQSGDDLNCLGVECVEKILINRNNKIKGWCGVLWSPTTQTLQPCFSYLGIGANYFLDIKFKRPDPDAIFKLYRGAYPGGTPLNLVCTDSSDNAVDCTGWAICLISPQGREKRVTVYDTGQISVENVVENATPADICSDGNFDTQAQVVNSPGG